MKTDEGVERVGSRARKLGKVGIALDYTIALLHAALRY